MHAFRIDYLLKFDQDMLHSVLDSQGTHSVPYHTDARKCHIITDASFPSLAGEFA
jgi:hypothetical protein